MSDRPEPNGPDLTLGIALDKLVDGATLLGHVGDDDVILARIGNDFFRGWSLLHPLPRPTRRRPGGRRHGSMSLAPRLFRPVARITRPKSHAAIETMPVAITSAK